MCDALNFVYVQKVKKKKSADGDVDIDEDGVDFEMQPVISIDLDEGGLCNNYDESEDETNLGCKGNTGDCDLNYVALRDSYQSGRRIHLQLQFFYWRFLQTRFWDVVHK